MATGKRSFDIRSYFSLPTDLAAEFSAWPEFVSGREYNVDLLSADEAVHVRLYREMEEGEEYPPYVSVRGTGDGPLFHRVLGVVIHALAQHSDDLQVERGLDAHPFDDPAALS